MLARRPLVWLASALLIGVVWQAHWPGGILPVTLPAAAALAVAGVLLAGRRGDSPGSVPVPFPAPDDAEAPHSHIGGPVRLADLFGRPPHSDAGRAAIPPAERSPLAAKAGTGWRRRREAWLFAAGLLAMAAGAWRERSVSERWREGFASLPEFAEIEAVVTNPPEEAILDDAPGFWRAAATIRKVDGRVLARGLPVRIGGHGRRDFGRGDVLGARVRKEYTPGPAFPAAFDARQWLAGEGLAGEVRIVRRPRAPSPPPAQIQSQYQGQADAAGGEDDNTPYTVTPAGGWVPRRGLDAWRRGAVRRLFGEVGGDEAGLLAAMIYGFRRELDAGIRDAFRRVGIGHVLAISGLHVGLIIWLAWTVLGWFRPDRRTRAAVCIVLCLLYLGVSGARVAATRATVMTVIHLGGHLVGRRSDLSNSLGAAALVLVSANPAAVFDLGFQLSFLAVLFISRFDREARPWYGVLAGLRGGEPGVPAHGRWRRPLAPARPGAGRGEYILYGLGWLTRRSIYAATGLAVLSLAAWIGNAPLVARSFGQVNLAGLWLNLAVIPLMGAVLVGGVLSPVAALAPGAAWTVPLALAPTRLLVALARWTDGLPGRSLWCAPPSWGMIAVFYAGWLLLFTRRAFAARDGIGFGSGSVRTVRAATVLGFALVVLGGIGQIREGSPVGAPAATVATVLPGAWRSGDVAVVEHVSGAVVVAGPLARSELETARLLQYLRRRRVDAIIDIRAGDATETEDANAAVPNPAFPGSDGNPPRYTVLRRSRPNPDNTEGGVNHDAFERGYAPLPGCPWLRVAAGRDRNGRLTWLALSTDDGVELALGHDLWPEQAAWRLSDGRPGSSARAVFLTLRGRPPAPDWPPAISSGDAAAARIVLADGRRFPPPPAGGDGTSLSGWRARAAWGAVRVDAEKVVAFDGARWAGISP